MTTPKAPSHTTGASPASPAGRLQFFYGWLMLPVVMLINIFTAPGQTYGVAVFNPHLCAALSLSSSQLSGAYTLGTLLAAVPMIWVGALMDRHGPRKILAGVVLIFGLTCLGMSQVAGLFTLFLAFFFLRLLGQGAMGMLASNTLAMWFNRRLGLASGLSNIGMAVAMGGFPVLSLLLIQTYGWRWAYAILGLAVWLLLLPLLALVFRNRPEDVGQEPDGGLAPRAEPVVKEPGSERIFTLKDALRTRSYWIAAATMASWSMIGTGVHFHIVPIFLERGLTAANAAAMFSIHAAVIIVARLGGGLLADRVPANLLIAASTISHCAGIVILNRADPQWMPALFALLFALGSGLWMAVNETLWVHYYGRAHLGKIRGSVVTIGVGTSSLGPFAMGLAYDTFGSFSQILWAFAILVALLALLGLLAAPPRNSPSR